MSLREVPAHQAPAYGGSMPTMLTASRLRERQWTDAMVRKLLGPADDYAANVAYPGGAPVRLYLLSRVEQLEAGDEFKAAKEQASKRQGASLKSRSTKRQATLAWIERLDGPQLPQVARAELTIIAVGWHNSTFAWRGDTARWLTGMESEPDLAVVTVDFIVDKLHGFEGKLRAALGRNIEADDLALIRGKIFTAIAGAFPWLAAECERRKAEARLV